MSRTRRIQYVGTVNVEHPVRPNQFIPLLPSHRRVVEDRVCEAIERAAMLGAPHPISDTSSR